MSDLKRTPIYSRYEKYGAKTIDFGGWDLPVQFSSIKQEHENTRTKAGLFDVSHMGEIIVKGPKSREFLQQVVTNDVNQLVPKKAQYTFMCYENGGTVDDFIIYMLSDNEYLLVVNAANTEKDYEWLQKNNTYPSNELMIENVSDQFALLAIQGPKAEEILQTLTTTNLKEITFFRFDDSVQLGTIPEAALISRTGYTGEDGFEIYINQAYGADLWNLLLEKGSDMGLVPVGLGARDTLRLEAGLPLYGQELTKDITPIEAGLSFAVKVDKESDFIGKDVLKQQKENGAPRKLVGIEMLDKGIPRTGYDVLNEDEVIGQVTSGTQSPTLGKNIGLALIDANYTALDSELTIQVRKRKLKAKVIKKSFLK